MNTTPTNDSAHGQVGEVGTTKQTSRKPITKLDRVIGLLKTRPEGLNRFEAESFGEHCLNSTVARLRQRGEIIHSRWETVPTNFCASGVRVLRYWGAGTAEGKR